MTRTTEESLKKVSLDTILVPTIWRCLLSRLDPSYHRIACYARNKKAFFAALSRLSFPPSPKDSFQTPLSTLSHRFLSFSVWYSHRASGSVCLGPPSAQVCGGPCPNVRSALKSRRVGNAWKVMCYFALTFPHRPPKPPQLTQLSVHTDSRSSPILSILFTGIILPPPSFLML